MPTAPRMTADLKVVRDATTLARQGPAWDALATRMGSPLLAHAWFQSCAEAFGGELHVIQVWRDGRLVAAAPLVATGVRRFRRLEILGAAALYEPTGFLYEDESALHALCRAVAELELPLLLHRIPRESLLRDELRTATEGRGWWITRDGGDSPYAELPGTWERYLQTRSSQRRYDLRRARRRLEACGSVGLRFLTPPECELDPLLDLAFSVEASGWKGQAGSAIALRPAMRDFLVRYAHRASRVGELRICLLELDSTPIAVEIAVQAHRRFWVLKIGYDERWAQCSPGLQLLTESVRESIESGCTTHEFLGTADAWVMPWADSRHTHETLRYYPRNWRGTSAWIADQAGRARAFRKRGSSGAD